MEAVGYVENALGPGEMFLKMRAKAGGSMEDDSQISHPHIGMPQIAGLWAEVGKWRGRDLWSPEQSPGAVVLDLSR